MTQRRNWTNDELLVALKIYCELNFGQLDHRNKRIIEVAKYLDRTASSLAMKLVNFASLDPAMNGKGLKAASKADKEIINDFLHNPEKIIIATENAYNIMMNKNVNVITENNNWFDDKIITVTEKTAITKIRTVQRFFRNVVISSYENKCAFCELNIKELLVASHIIPWSVSETIRANPANGLSLCTLHDKAFDKGLLTVDDNYSIKVSKNILSCKNNMVNEMLIKFDGKQITKPFRFEPNIEYLKWHRENIFKNEIL